VIRSGTKKWRLLRAYLSGHPVWCGWQVTYRCNFRCNFCHYWCNPLGLEPEPTLEQYEVGARKLAQFGTLFISLAGGEPLLRHDLPELVETIGRFHLPFVTTNGWLVTPTVADDLMRAGVWGVSVSIDYANAAQHDTRRGSPGAWRQAWRAVEMLSAARRHRHQRVNVMAVLMDDNIDQVETLIQMAAERGAYFMIQCYGHRKTGADRWGHNDGPVSPRLTALRRTYRNFLSNPTYLSRFDDYLRGEGIPGCRAWGAFFNIDSVGDIAICVENMGAPVANLYRNHTRVIHDRLAAAARSNRCTDCWYNCRGEVEALYNVSGLATSLPTLFFDTGEVEV
jgi:MoaA/NifB/PqqE/SkfB family radical SAM enzyme